MFVCAASPLKIYRITGTQSKLYSKMLKHFKATPVLDTCYISTSLNSDLLIRNKSAQNLVV